MQPIGLYVWLSNRINDQGRKVGVSLLQEIEHNWGMRYFWPCVL